MIKFDEWLELQGKRRGATEVAAYWYRAFRDSPGLQALLRQWEKECTRPAMNRAALQLRRQRGAPPFSKHVLALASEKKADARLRAFNTLLQTDRRFMRGATKWQAIRNCLTSMGEGRCISYALELWEPYAAQYGIVEMRMSLRERTYSRQQKRLARHLTRGGV